MIRKSTVVPFQWPRLVERVEDCDFYHAIDLPGFGLQKGRWDLRKAPEEYFGKQSVKGKTVLDVGTGSGFICFEMEKRGANMIAFDFDGGRANRQHDLVPYHDFEKRFNHSYNDFFAMLMSGLDKMKNSFWLTHRVLKSKARVFYGDIYDCEADFGPVDIVFFGNILLHLKSPIEALNNFAPYAREKVIITEACWRNYDYESDDAICFLEASTAHEGFASWWQLTPGFLKQYLGVLGFKTFELTFHTQRWVERDWQVKHFTLVASR
jgi:SAM-dependent methyltransferase